MHVPTVELGIEVRGKEGGVAHTIFRPSVRMDSANHVLSEMVMEMEMPKQTDLFDNMQLAETEMENAMDLRGNPLLATVQQALCKQLLERKEELDERLRDKQAEFKVASKRREDAGVKLYGLQKTLATLHTNLNYEHQSLASASALHHKADEQLSDLQNIYTEKQSEMESLKVKMEKAQQELDKISLMLKQIESYNENIKGEIAVNRRITYSTEEHIVKAEKEKKKQDMLIAQLQHHIKQQLQKQAICKAQLAAQQRETKVARTALSEAGIDMESTNSEKKHVTSQWKSSLVVLARCDEALQGLLDSIGKQKEQEMTIHYEKDALRKSIQTEQEKAEVQAATLKKLDGQIKLLQKQVQQTVAKRVKSLEEYGKLLVTLEKSEALQEKVKREKATIEEKVKAIEKDFQKESQSLNAMEIQMIQSLSEQTTLERSHQQIVQRTLDVRQELKKEEMTATELEFELACIRNDIIRVQNHHHSLHAILSSLEDEVKQKLSIVSKIEMEIRRRHSEIDVKSKEIDRLNKQYEKLTSNLGNKNVTPWEQLISKIQVEISLKVKASSQLQGQWLTMQSELVTSTSENNNLVEKFRRLDNEMTIVIQRNRRLETEFSLLTKNIKDLDNSVQAKHKIIVRLNDLIAKNRSLQEFLENENFNIQTTNVLALREMEEEIMRMEITIRDCNKEKDEIDREVQELQHHISLWTSKISFEKKTQETLMQAILSPMAIAGAMKSDLEKLKSKLNDLTSIRQKIIVALESKVSDRNALSIKAKATSSKKDFEGPVGEEAVLIKTVGELRRILREMQRSMITIDGRVEALHKKKLFLASKVSELDSTILTEVKKQEELRTKLREAIENKSIKLMDTALKQRMVKRYYMVKENKWKVQLKFSLEVELGDSQRKCNILVELLKSFIYDLPQLQAKLESIFLQLDCVKRL